MKLKNSTSQLQKRIFSTALKTIPLHAKGDSEVKTMLNSI